MSNRYKLLLCASPCLAALLVFGPTLLPVQNGDAPSKSATPRVSGAEAAPLRVVLALTGVLALAVTTLVIWRRLAWSTPNGGGAQRTMRIKESLRLSPRHRLHLVAIDDRLLVVGEGERGVSCVLSIGGEEEMPPAVDADVVAMEKQVVLTPAARSRQRTIEEDDGAMPRDLAAKVAPPPSRGLPQSPAEFRHLLERVRAEVAP